jgi:hypothetical protein
MEATLLSNEDVDFCIEVRGIARFYSHQNHHFA